MPSSVDGIFVTADDVPRERAQLSRMLQSLRPGGCAVMALPRGRFVRRELETLLAAGGLAIVHDRAGAGRTERIVVAQNTGGLTERPTHRYSIVLACDPEQPQATREQLRDWLELLTKRLRPEGLEVVLVSDGPSELGSDDFPAELDLRSVTHYDRFGLGAAAQTGMRFARGRRLLIDLSRGAVGAESFFDLLGPMLAKSESRPDCVLPIATETPDASFPQTPPYQGGATAAARRRALQGQLRRAISGATEPKVDFMLCDFAVARGLLPDPLRRKRPGEDALTVRGRFARQEVPIRRRRPGPRQPSLASSLVERFLGAGS